MVHDDGRQVRCFAHVADVIRAVQGLVDAPAAVGQVVNVGSDQPISILSLAERVISLVAETHPIREASQITFQSYAEAYSVDFEDVRVRVPCLDRLHQLLPDYRPRHSLDDTIREVIASHAAG